MQTTTYTVVQVLALLLISLVAGSMFGIWRGYPIAEYSPATLLEVHKAAIRGLNTLLPAMAVGCLILVLIFAFANRSRPACLSVYLATAAAIVVGGLITRLVNQPINEQVMTWTITTLPHDWVEIRDRWWAWHQVRLSTTIIAQLLLISAIFVDRSSTSS